MLPSLYFSIFEVEMIWFICYIIIYLILPLAVRNEVIANTVTHVTECSWLLFFLSKIDSCFFFFLDSLYADQCPCLHIYTLFLCTFCHRDLSHTQILEIFFIREWIANKFEKGDHKILREGDYKNNRFCCFSRNCRCVIRHRGWHLQPSG